MARQTKPPRRLPKSLRRGALPRPASQVWLAGLGALADSLKTGRGRFDALLAEGRRVQATGGDAAREAIQQAEEAESGATEGALAAAEFRAVAVEEAVASHTPASADVSALRGRIEILVARIASLDGAPTDVTVEATPRGWTVALGGRVAHVCPTRREAVAHGRRAARAAAPARLVVRRADGTEAETVDYGV